MSEETADEDVASKVSELAKRRGFFFPASESYGGVAGFYTYGPEGAALKRNLEESWRERFAVEEGHQEVDAPTIMPEPVFEASGHLDTFDDMLVECGECGESHRADHLVEDGTDIEEAEAMSIEAIETVIADEGLVCPACGSPLAGEPVESFNLMFATNIGPGSSAPGYLRPETAQGIFVEFPRLAEYARNQLPFGVAQIGRAYRNEISPRRAIVRVRELTQAELEFFFDPERDEPDLASVSDVELPLYPVDEQLDPDGELRHLTVREAVDDGVVSEPWIAYYLGIAREWYEAIGVDMDRFRYRQHQPDERSHYASDCWDAESEIDGDWIELTGFAYRTDYDLAKHDEYADDDYTVFRQYDDPQTVERPTVDPDMSVLGPEFGADAGAVAEGIERLAALDPGAFEDETVTVEADGEAYEVPIEATGFAVEEVTESGEHVTPHVVEPSFGVDRLVYTVLAHNYQEEEIDDGERTVLELDPAVAPTVVGVFPLMDKDGLGERARELATDLRAAGVSVTYDDSGAIGRRYRRQDEIGTPFCVTVDYDTLEDETVTLRDRDSTEQVRVRLADLPETLLALRSGDSGFEEL